MADIAEIMDMIDWHMPSEIRITGVSLARDTETIIPFIQPLTPKYNKNVWEGCAVIIAEKSDENLKPYLHGGVGYWKHYHATRRGKRTGGHMFYV